MNANGGIKTNAAPNRFTTTASTLLSLAFVVVLIFVGAWALGAGAGVLWELLTRGFEAGRGLL